MAAKIRVLIADDHLIFRLGLRTLLSGEPNIDLVGEAMTGSQTIERFQEVRPDVSLLDLRLPDGGGMGARRAIRQTDGDAKILILSSYGNEEEVYSGLQGGAAGYVLKDAGREELLAAI